MTNRALNSLLYYSSPTHTLAAVAFSPAGLCLGAKKPLGGDTPALADTAVLCARVSSTARAAVGFIGGAGVMPTSLSRDVLLGSGAAADGGTVAKLLSHPGTGGFGGV